ncbi:PREDICTED: ras-related protein RabJ isoform X1 [Acromyrmex echinatior]|uniref:Ras-related protein RabJ n=1 Tax=Acromyrmex echinatior TaxID=103372 RepID=F4WMQ4_ACREC|nr:PREDICTED: ras-related protein RabJ isoform X1 [Acromyrmex echinatior]EGI64531.1 Ras-related protein RabJ [Acromyrmex echinatior]
MKTIEGKVIMLGSQGVGKTSLIGRYVGNVEHVSPTIAASFFNCKINLEDVKIKLQVWDTAGQERFRSMAPMYYRTCNAALLVFDLTQYSTFVAIKSWVKELQQNVEETMVLVLIGNKSDLVQKRQVDGEEGRRYATTIGATYHEISVLYNEGVKTVFLAIAMGLRRMASDNNDNTTLKISDSNNFFRNDDMLLPSPSIEESPQNTSIAHGIHEKPFTCC